VWEARIAGEISVFSPAGSELGEHTSSTDDEPRLTGPMEASDTLWTRAQFTAAQYRKTDPAWSATLGMGSTSVSTNIHPFAAQIIAALSASPSGGGATSTGRVASTGTARGDGVRKAESMPGFPAHVDAKLIICHAWGLGKECGYGAQRNRYCYLST
jgi:hypothetical protein